MKNAFSFCSSSLDDARRRRRISTPPPPADVDILLFRTDGWEIRTKHTAHLSSPLDARSTLFSSFSNFFCRSVGHNSVIRNGALWRKTARFVFVRRWTDSSGHFRASVVRMAAGHETASAEENIALRRVYARARLELEKCRVSLAENLFLVTRGPEAKERAILTKPASGSPTSALTRARVRRYAAPVPLLAMWASCAPQWISTVKF